MTCTIGQRVVSLTFVAPHNEGMDGDDGDAGVLEEDEWSEDPEGDFESPTRRRRWVPVVVAVGVLAIAGIGLGLWLSGSSSSATVSGPEGVAIPQVPNLASANSTHSGAPVDGITCRTASQQVVKYHIHVHVAVYVNGQQMRLPAGAGIPSPKLYEHLADGLFVDNGLNNCLYWLHVHSYDDVVHVESPYEHTFMLGQFFDIWNQPLGPDQVGPAKGRVVVFENGKRLDISPRDVPLLPHAVIQLDVGQPVVPYQPVPFTVNELCGAGTQNCAAG